MHNIRIKTLNLFHIFYFEKKKNNLPVTRDATCQKKNQIQLSKLFYFESQFELRLKKTRGKTFYKTRKI